LLHAISPYKGHHLVFPGHPGKPHATNGTPHVTTSLPAAIMSAIPTVPEIITNPLTTFGEAGTLAAFGFLCPIIPRRQAPISAVAHPACTTTLQAGTHRLTQPGVAGSR
jgi:hypothetical protein